MIENRLALTALLFFLHAGNTKAELTVVSTGVNDFALLSANQIIGSIGSDRV